MKRITKGKEDMREIKFRAFDKEGNNYSKWKPQMVYPENWKEAIETDTRFPHPYKSNRYEFMQFTGMKDSKDVEIYEDDVIRFLDGEITSTESGMDCDEYWEVGRVYWCDKKQGWDVTNRNDVDWIDCWSDVEIIGNIYENPELLSPPSQKGESKA